MSQMHELRFHEPFPLPVRLVLVVAGLITWIAPYELLVERGFPALDWPTLPLWFIGLVAGSMGLGFIAVAIAGVTRNLTVDPYTRTIRVDAKGAFGFARTWRHPFDRFSKIVVRHEDDEGAKAFVIEACFAKGGRNLLITRVDNENESAACAARIRAAMKIL